MKNRITAEIYDLHVEHYSGDVIGIATSTPRLSWKYTDALKSTNKVEIKVIRSMFGKVTEEKTFIVNPKNHLLLAWPDTPLASREHVICSVRVIDDEEKGKWASNLEFEVGILDYFELQAQFIGSSKLTGETDHRRLPLVRSKFEIEQQPVYARLYLSALGLVEGEINGKKFTDNILTPGWTDYNHRVTYWSFDVQSELRAGKNVLGFWIGDGWYRGRLGFKGGKSNFYGNKIGVFAQLELGFASGERKAFYSNSYDGQWKVIDGPILESNLYEGETYDSREEIFGWSSADLDDSNWQPVAEIPYNKKKMEIASLEPIKAREVHHPISITKLGEKHGKSNWLIDFGQNCTQRVKLHVKHAEKNDVISLQHAEVLEKDGSISTRPLRRGYQLDKFISNGNDELFEAKFSIHGFRYVELRGWRGDLTSQDLDTTVYYSAMKRTGYFGSSDSTVNKLHDNILWSMRSNFVSIPTDCPQRDERLGWTGDISLFSKTASYLYDTTNFLMNWLKDVSYEQSELGTVPFYTPYVPLAEWSTPQAIAIWGDAVVRVPWTLYMASGDKQVLCKNYEMIKRWIEEVRGYLSPDGVWDRRPRYSLGQLGDWLDPSAPANNPVQAMTEKELVATAFYARSCQIAMRSAVILERDNDTDRYRKLYKHVVRGFINRFLKKTGEMTSDTQCAYTLAISLGLLDKEPAMKEEAGIRLANLVKESNGKISTGFAGTPYILSALTETNHLQVAYDLFMSDKCPSWLYQVKMGGTTTWERWDSMLPDGSVNPGDMTSFNHYSLGAVANWMHEIIGGLRQIDAGWRKFRIEPQPGGGISSASAVHETPFGTAKVSWTKENDKLTVKFTVPYGSEAELVIPGYDMHSFFGGKYDMNFSLKPTH
ncbi:glycoside hydrolase family 78 protein [Levilactobacillus angrenensis]|uniref:alpha-L-rhamnosidase n=1 Tax=Levilactobacillus angrenensis TaxID=2486020 RepID=A0ABW1U9T1_9LACO|nr:glycoside hydrolase family 78 protein [Levilactobacillus angrenensis]